MEEAKKLTKKRIDVAVQCASDAFWEEIGLQFPEIKFGDFDPKHAQQVHHAMEKAVRRWVQHNHPEGSQLQVCSSSSGRKRYPPVARQEAGNVSPVILPEPTYSKKPIPVSAVLSDIFGEDFGIVPTEYLKDISECEDSLEEIQEALSGQGLIMKISSIRDAVLETIVERG